MENKQLALFDLDGTLFDTGRVNYFSYRDALAIYGVTLDEDYFVTHCNGRHYTEFLPELLDDPQKIESVHRIKKESYHSNLHHARQNTQLFSLIHAIRPFYHLAVVTTASYRNSMDILAHFGCAELFDLLITQENITHTKPDPEGFLKAMAHFGAAADKTVIFEDSSVGLQAARATGATVFAVNQF